MDDYDYDGEDGQGPTETIYNKDDCKMQRVKIKRKRGATQKRQKGDYESPYAEYLLGAIKDPEQPMKRGEAIQRQNIQSIDSKFKKIKSIYN